MNANTGNYIAKGLFLGHAYANESDKKNAEVADYGE